MDSRDPRIAAYRARFCYVADTYCIQMAAGHYVRAYRDPATKQEPLALTDELIARHLEARTTLAFYTAKRVGDLTLCREGIVECDDKRAIPDPERPGAAVRYEPVNGRELMRQVQDRLARMQIPSALELSRRGARVRVFAAEPVPAHAMQNLLLLGLGYKERLLMAKGQTAVEINPKQDVLEDGKVGNSVRGPFGLHRKSGERYGFIYPDGSPAGQTLGAQLAYVLGVPTVDVLRVVERRPWLEEERMGILDRLPEPLHDRVFLRAEAVPRRLHSHGAEASPIDQWKAAHPLGEILARYGLHVTGHGNQRCPLPHHAHGDKDPSLSVDLENNRWYCHTSQMGGSQLDFLMAAEGLRDAREALTFLRARGEIAEPAARPRLDASRGTRR